MTGIWSIIINLATLLRLEIAQKYAALMLWDMITSGNFIADLPKFSKTHSTIIITRKDWSKILVKMYWIGSNGFTAYHDDHLECFDTFRKKSNMQDVANYVNSL